MEREAMGASDHLPFACQCGAVSGVVEQASPRVGDHVVCCCSDCRDLARLFGKEARILEEHGGTPLYQGRCARMHIHSGRDRLASLHMTEQATTRWYAYCCGTPLFNTWKDGRVPYVTTLLGNCDHARVDRLLGSPIGYICAEEATSDVGDLPRMSMAGLMRRFLPRMIRDILSGDRRRSELFDATTFEPIVQPRHLTQAEKQALGRL